MAKGNILLGMGRGKLGDIVLTRIDGQQIARPRNRQPKNPRTNKQLYQRAVMATVMQAYSAGIKIFDHSFEGKAVGAANQRYFMKINAKKLRAQIASEVDGEVAEASQIGRVVAPGVTSPVPSNFQVSEGSLQNTLFQNLKMAASLENETCAQYVARMGLVPDDIFTFVILGCRTSDIQKYVFELMSSNSLYSKQCVSSFFWGRYRVKPTCFTNDSTDFTLGDILDQANGEGNVEIQYDFDMTVTGMDIDPSVFFDLWGGCACIRSRENEDLRSTETMTLNDRGMIAYQAGIISKYALAAWKQGSANLGDSDLILEGGDE